MHPRIEKSQFTRGQYVGYCQGVWNITRDGKQWVARHRDNPMGTPTIWGKTLASIGHSLDRWESTLESGHSPYKTEPPKTVSYVAEVIADNSGQWAGNGLRFATRETAEAYARDLMWRWTSVRQWRVVESDEPVNT